MDTPLTLIAEAVHDYGTHKNLQMRLDLLARVLVLEAIKKLDGLLMDVSVKKSTHLWAINKLPLPRIYSIRYV